jgi:hypothetical protein
MKAKRLTLLVLLYVTLDLSNPFIPGAFSFNPDESVDGIDLRDPRGPRVSATSAHSPAVRLVAHKAPPAVVQRARETRVLERFVDMRQAHGASADPQSLTEDH